MQRSQTEEEEEQSAPRREQTASLSPGRAFVILLAALLVLGTAGYLFIGNDEPRSDSVVRGPGGSNGAQSSPFELTNQEAITKFKDLDAKRLRAYRTTDLSLIPAVFADGSRIADRASREIKALDRDGVAAKTTFKTRSLEIIHNRPSVIRLRQIVIVTPKFVYRRSGENITNNPAPERQIVLWTLKLDGAEWHVGKSLIVAAEPAGGAS